MLVVGMCRARWWTRIRAAVHPAPFPTADGRRLAWGSLGFDATLPTTVLLGSARGGVRSDRHHIFFTQLGDDRLHQLRPRPIANAVLNVEELADDVARRA